MKRYKYIGLLLLAGLAAACQKETVAPAGAGYSTEAILFTTPYTVSKSAAMRDGDFKVGDKVGVLGYCKATGLNGEDYSASEWDTKKPFAKPEVFYNQELTYKGNGVLSYEYTGWNPAPVGDLHPWYDEEDYTYAFFAYYPYVNVNSYYNPGTITAEDGRTSMGTIRLSDEDDTGDPTFTYTMPHTGRNTSSPLDLDVVPDVMLAYTVDHVRSDGAVALNFRHMLCAFEFEVNNYNPYQVTINSLRFSGTNFYKSFTITGQEQDYTPNSDRYSGYFNLLPGGAITCEAADTDENDVVIAPSNTKITVSRDSEDPVDLLFIPDADGKITERECTVTVETSEGDVRQQNIKEGMSFEPGTRSIFSINIIGNNFLIQVRTLEKWSDGGDSNIYFD